MRYLKEFKDYKNIDYDEIYTRLWDKMLYTCLKYTNDMSKAEDYCQEGFIKAFDNIHKWDGSGSLDAWIKKVIVNNTIDSIRRNKMKFTDSEYNFDSTEEEEDEIVDISIDDIKKILPQLPPSYRSAIELYYIQNMKHKDISKKLNISIGTSKTNLMKAKQKIKKLIGV